MMKKFNRYLAVLLVAAMLMSGCKAEQKEPFEEMRACWVASIGNLDFPSAMGLSAKEMQEEMDEIVDNCKEMNLNTIFFQVRPNGDALYPSEFFPWSAYLSGQQGRAPNENFDCLSYFIEAAHKAKMQLHAWINPYRIGTGANAKERLSSDNPAVVHPEYTISCKAGLYYDPGLPEVRRLILQGVAELVQNYELDGIHFDDYFYPYDLEGFDDSATFTEYGKGRSLEDFRRASVDSLVEAAFKVIKTMNPSVSFGISPFGIWANKEDHQAGSNTHGMSSYSEIYSDSKKWVEEGWVDYICPQIYWSRVHPAAPFGELADWWDSLCQKEEIPLVIGLAAYKIGGEEKGWESEQEIIEQIAYGKGKKSYGGYCLFRYGVLKRIMNEKM